MPARDGGRPMPHSSDRKPACSTVNDSVPDELICQKCGALAEVWSDEQSVICETCGDILNRD